MYFNHLNILKPESINNLLKCETIENGYKIPNIIHQTFATQFLPLQIIQVIKRNKEICHNCKFIFYDDKQCEELLQNNFNDEIFNAYKKINPSYGAMRADFFRYCVLYLYGGIYLDIKSKITYPLFKIITKEDICILDIPRTSLEKWRFNSPTYEQWLLIFAPRHPYLLEIINQLVNNINKKYIPKEVNNYPLNKKGKILNISGPDAFTKAINSYINNNNKILHRSIDYNSFANLNPYIDYRAMYVINKKKHYSEVNEPIYL